jgi:hypothetical protein
MHPQTAAELWALRRAADDARCVAALHPMGLELRFFMNGHPLITRAFDTWDALMRQSRLWRADLETRGWQGTSIDSIPAGSSA